MELESGVILPYCSLILWLIPYKPSSTCHPFFFFHTISFPVLQGLLSAQRSSVNLRVISFHFVPSSFPLVMLEIPSSPQLKTTLCSRGSGQASLSQQSQLVSAKLCVSPEASLWQPCTSLTLLDPLSPLLDILVCFLNVALQLAASSGCTSSARYLLLRYTLAVFSVHLFLVLGLNDKT